MLYACGNHHGQVDHRSLGSQSLLVEHSCSSPLQCLSTGSFLATFRSFLPFPFFVFITTAFMGLYAPKHCSTLPMIKPPTHAPPSRTDVHAFRIIYAGAGIFWMISYGLLGEGGAETAECTSSPPRSGQNEGVLGLIELLT